MDVVGKECQACHSLAMLFQVAHLLMQQVPQKSTKLNITKLLRILGFDENICVQLDTNLFRPLYTNWFQTPRNHKFASAPPVNLEPDCSYQVPRTQLPHAELPLHPAGDQEALIVTDDKARNTAGVRVVDGPKQLSRVGIVRSNLPISPSCQHHVLLSPDKNLFVQTR